MSIIRRYRLIWLSSAFHIRQWRGLSDAVVDGASSWGNYNMLVDRDIVLLVQMSLFAAAVNMLYSPTTARASAFFFFSFLFIAARRAPFAAVRLFYRWQEASSKCAF